MTKVLNMKIDGMSCASCLNRIDHHLANVNGVLQTDISIERGFGRVHFDDELASADVISNTVARIGYDVTVLSVLDETQL